MKTTAVALVLALLLSAAVARGDGPLPAGVLHRLGTENLRHPVAQSVAYSPDGTILATGGMDIRLWDARTRRLLRTLLLPDRPIDGDAVQLKFTGDGKTLYAQGSGLGRVSVFDVATGKRLVHPQPETTSINAFDISPDGKILATAMPNDELILWKAGTREKLRTLTGHKRTVLGAEGDSHRNLIMIQSIAFSPDGKYLASQALYDNSLRVFEVATGKLKHSLDSPALHMTRLVFSPDGYLATYKNSKPGWVTENSRIVLWDLATGKVHYQCPWDAVWHGHSQHAVAFSRDGKWMAGSAGNGRLSVWDRATGKVRFNDSGSYNGPWNHAFESVAFSNDGDTLVGACGAVAMWDLKTGRDLLTDEGHTAVIRGMDISPDGTTIASSDGTIRLWDAKTGKERRRLCVGGGTVCLGFAPDGRTLAVGSNGSKHAHLFDAISGKELRRFPLPFQPIRVCFAPDGKTLAAATGDNLTVHFFDVESGNEVRRLVFAPAARFGTSYQPFRFSPDGKYLASIAGGSGLDVALAELNGKEPVVIGRLGSYVRDMAFSPDGEYLAWSDANDVCVWDVCGKRLKEKLKGVGPCALGFTPDGNYLIAGKKLLPLNPKLPRRELPVTPGFLAFSRTGGVLVMVPESECTLLVIDPKKLEPRIGR